MREFLDFRLLLIAACGAAFLILVLIILARWINRRRRPRDRFERAVKRVSFGEIRDFVIPDALDGYIHIDRVLLTESGALVLEFKDVAGTIFAGERLDEWPILTRRGRYPLRNPLDRLKDRVNAVQALVPELPVKGQIVFSDASEFPKGRPQSVRLLSELSGKPRQRCSHDHEQAWIRLRQRIAESRVESEMPRP